MKMKVWKLVLMGVVSAMFIFAASAMADTVLWKWVDEKGNAHYVEYLDQVPKKYRGKAVKIVIKSPGANEPASASSESSGEKVKVKDTRQEKKKQEWKQKAINAYNRVGRLEKQIAELEKKCAELRHKYLVVPTIANRQASDKCYKDLNRLKDELEKARKYLEEGIYKEAEKEGVPSEWIDEGIAEAKSKSKK